MRDLVFESHTPAVYIYRRYELTADSNLSTFLFSTFPIVYIPVHLYSPRLRRRFRRSILTAVMRPPFLYVRIR